MALTAAEQAASAGRLVRLRYSAQLVAAALLFAIVALLVTRIAERSALRLRSDWTREAENTLEPASLSVLARLPGEVTVDVFFRAADFPLESLAIQVQERVRKLLYLARDTSRGRITLVFHDLSAGRIDPRSQSRLFELGSREVEPGGLLGISVGKRRELLRLRGDLADFDPGDPNGLMGAPRPARVVAYRAEESLMCALLKVSQTDAPRILFTRGHGELEFEGTAEFGLTRLRAELEAEGFQVSTWDSQRLPAVPEDCRVLALIGPEQTLGSSELAAIRTFVERGGRLVCAPGLEPLPDQDSIGTLLARWGVEIAPRGIIARAQPSVTGELQYGTNSCAQLWIDRGGMNVHTITEPLRRGERHVLLNGARVLDVGQSLPGGTVLQVLRSGEGSWLDLPEPGARVGDWTPQASERRGPFVVAAAILFPPQRAAGEPLRSPDNEQPQARVFVLGAAAAAANASFETNRDLLRNAFDWAASRDWRVSVHAREHSERRLDMRDAALVARTHFALVIGLPLLSLALGLFTAWRRRK